MTNTPRNEIKMLSLYAIATMFLLVNFALLVSVHMHKKHNATLIKQNELLRMHSTPFDKQFVEVAMEFPTLSFSEQILLAQHRVQHGRVNQ